jgi:putative PIN family toxin of toxin-antitoxin system
MRSKRIKIILDTNIWNSFVIGKRLIEMERILKNSYIEVFVCEKLLKEVNDTLLKPKLRKYMSAERKNILLNYMLACLPVSIFELTTRSRDADDDYLITGDNDLLVLQQHYQTKILNFNCFLLIFNAIQSRTLLN